mgnify:CR=1 FL=1
MHFFYISLDDITRAIRDKNQSLPAGLIESKDNVQLLRTTHQLQSVSDVESVIVRANSAAKYTNIKQLAWVKEKNEERSVLYRSNGLETITLTVLKKESADILDVVNSVKSLVESQRDELQLKTITVKYQNDLSVFISRRLSVLSNNAVLGIAILMLILLAFLHKRIAVFVALAIPFSIIVGFLVMSVLSISLNLISLLGFILVIGMVVDNAIVVGEHIVSKFESGKSAKKACIEGTTEMIPPIIGSTLTTFAAFGALLFMGGTFGKFVRDIPFVVCITLTLSLLYSSFIMPVLMAPFLIRSRKKQNIPSFSQRLFERLQGYYTQSLTWVLTYRLRSILSLILIFFLSLLIAAKGMSFVLFPSEDAEQFKIYVEAPITNSLTQHANSLVLLEQHISTLPTNELDYFTSSIGTQQRSRSDVNRGSHYSEITVYLQPDTDRSRTARDIVENLREKFNSTDHPFESIRFSVRRGGPPVGKAISINLSGDAYSTIEIASKELKTKLSKISAIRDIDSNFKPGKPELQISTNEGLAAIHSVPLSNIARNVRTAFAGTVATTIRTETDDIDVIVMLEERYRQNTNYLRDLLIPSTKGALIKLKYLASFSEVPGFATLYHYNTDKTITISADIDRKQSTVPEINALIKPILMEIQDRYPSIQFSLEGETKDTNESISNLFKAFFISLLLIYIIILSLFNRLFDPLLIMLAIPFGFIGIILAFFIHQEPISFMMLMGSIGMTGVVVNNSIILVHVINKQQSDSLYDAVFNGSLKRFRAVMITSITTLFALFPTAYGIGGDDPFVEPMCLALSWGVFLSTILTLYLIPCIRLMANDVSNWVTKRLSK